MHYSRQLTLQLNRSLSVKLGIFPHFLSALASNIQFIIKLVKMWPGGTLHVVVGTLKISLDRLKKKKKKSADSQNGLFAKKFTKPKSFISLDSRFVDLDNSG